MKDPFQNYTRERDEKVRQNVLDAFLLLGEGKSDEEVTRKTGLSKEDVQKAKELLKEEVWDEIDRKADQNGGHYVVPTTPDKVDTSDVSEFIQKRKRDK